MNALKPAPIDSRRASKGACVPASEQKAVLATPPVFIYGALRSGTTMFRLMLNSHPSVSNPGEADFLFDHLHRSQSGTWHYDLHELRMDRIFRAHGLTIPPCVDGLDLLKDMIDQLQQLSSGVLTLNVHRDADKIQAAISGVRFVHLLRDPRDVARSSIGMGWAGSSYYGVDHWVETERDWLEAARSIPAERVFTLKFEDLIRNLPVHLEQVCDFLGVPLSEQMLEYHLNSSYGPPQPSIAEKWRTNCGAREAALIEGKCGALLDNCGYEPASDPAVPTILERCVLAVRNRVVRWKVNIGKFGLLLFLAGHITRLPVFRSFRDSVRLKKDAVIVRSLK